MKTILNKIGAIRVTPVRFFGFWAILFALVFTLSSCSDDLDVQQSYPFTVEVMPYGDKITIRYFQYDGEGTLKLVDGPILTNNDRVLLESKTFRLNYTAKSPDAHKFLVVIQDNFGSTPWEQTFEFNGKDSGDDNGGMIVKPVNPGIINPVSQ